MRGGVGTNWPGPEGSLPAQPTIYSSRRNPGAPARIPDGMGEARGTQGAATPAAPQDERSAQLAWLPEVPPARSLKWARARQGRTAVRGKGAYRGVRGARGAGRVRAQVAVKFVLLGARVHGATAGAALLRACGLPTPPPRVAGCAPAPGPPRRACSSQAPPPAGAGGGPGGRTRSLLPTTPCR